MAREKSAPFFCPGFKRKSGFYTASTAKVSGRRTAQLADCPLDRIVMPRGFTK
jgi:hypothetical protein